MSEHFLIYGSGGQAKVIADILEKDGKKITGFIDDNNANWGREIFGYKVIGGFEEMIKLNSNDPENTRIIVGIGDNKIRKKLAEKIAAHNLKFGTAIHPSAQIAKDVLIGEGTVIMANASVNSSSVIGKHCIINTNSSVDHDDIIKDYAHIAPGAHLGGTVKVEELSWVGLGASVKHGIEIGSNSIIGAGAVVIKNIGSNCVYVGNPAKFLKNC
jgi:acetyltransferase EpsM